MINKAAMFTTNAHANQQRKHSNIPYVTHCFEVMKLLNNIGITDESILSAALLHDTIEDTSVTKDMIITAFSPYVANLVSECSRPESYKDRELPKVKTLGFLLHRPLSQEMFD